MAHADASPTRGELNGLPVRPMRPLSKEAVLSFVEQDATRRRVELNRLSLARKNMPRLASEETMLAGYMFARSVDGRNVEGADLDALRKGNSTVIETRKALAYGRGNVSIDIQATDHESSRRVAVGRSLIEHLKQTNKNMGTADLAAVAMFVKAGNCGEHAQVATILHVARLASDERSHQVKREGVDHDWAESRSDKGREHDVVIDAWGEGPAIFASDGAYTREEKRLHSVDVYQPDKAQAVGESIANTTQQLAADPRVDVAALLEKLRRQGYKYSKKSIWEPEPILHKSFARRVGKKLGLPTTVGAKLRRWARSLIGMGKKERSPRNMLLDEIRAAGVARSLGGSVKTAAQDAPGIVKAAKDLLRSAS